jgi:hypothetical protein
MPDPFLFFSFPFPKCEVDMPDDFCRLIPFPNNAIRRMATRVMPPAVSASLHWHGSRLGQVSVTEDVRQDIIFAQTPLFCLCVHVRTNINLFSPEIILQVGCQKLSRLQKTGIHHSKIG